MNDETLIPSETFVAINPVIGNGWPWLHRREKAKSLPDVHICTPERPLTREEAAEWAGEKICKWLAKDGSATAPRISKKTGLLIELVYQALDAMDGKEIVMDRQKGQWFARLKRK